MLLILRIRVKNASFYQLCLWFEVFFNFLFTLSIFNWFYTLFIIFVFFTLKISLLFDRYATWHRRNDMFISLGIHLFDPFQWHFNYFLFVFIAVSFYKVDIFPSLLLSYQPTTKMNFCISNLIFVIIFPWFSRLISNSFFKCEENSLCFHFVFTIISLLLLLNSIIILGSSKCESSIISVKFCCDCCLNQK